MARHVKITEHFGLVEAKNTQPETLVSWHAGFLLGGIKTDLIAATIQAKQSLGTQTQIAPRF
jgi:hypothetical protein